MPTTDESPCHRPGTETHLEEVPFFCPAFVQSSLGSEEANTITIQDLKPKATLVPSLVPGHAKIFSLVLHLH